MVSDLLVTQFRVLGHSLALWVGSLGDQLERYENSRLLCRSAQFVCSVKVLKL